NDKESVVELVFKYDNFSEFFNQVQARRSMQGAIQERLLEIKELKVELEESKVILTEKEARFAEDRSVLRDQKIIIERERLRRNQLLREARQEEAGYQELLSEIEAQQKETQEQIFELEDQLRQAIDPDSIPTAGTALFQWPAEGILTQGYGCTSFAKSSKFYPSCFHNGIDVASAGGTPIYAAADGVVLHMDYTPTAYGYWITIKHSNGLITLYGHLSLQKVRPGQTVKRGDLIGYMGSTGLSTGPHLHFTVFTANDYFLKPSRYSGMIPIGATVNPFDYLP
ncbi:MAG: peptidoglycan DD-metalloendopeptidase family protein, partial [Candidatus Spechtbacterales bacterium]|nr:peptidoglycan DD-metalloendopeptidase family protein [Candidatus Spechtbacterales bacterium]